jgi:hypothetical protein
MGALDGIIVMLLYVCFGVYLLMGLTLTILGGVYMGDAGAVGTTGIYLMLTGLAMMVIGGLAIFANLKQIWLILLVIELINIALFLVIYIMIVVVLMMASGTTDPIRRATTETWDETRQSLTLGGSDGEGSEGIYCETRTTANFACQNYYSSARTTTTCTLKAGAADAELETHIREGLLNCSAINDKVGTTCSTLATQCSQCDAACMEQQITDVKDAILPVSIFVFVVVVFLFINCTYNTILVSSSEDLSEGGIKKLMGMGLNGVLVLFALVLVIMGCVGAYQADDAGGDVPTSMIVTILTGVVVLGVCGVALAAIQLDNHLLLRLATIVMVFFTIFLTLMALLLGISSGAVMDDMGYYYDVNYPKLRNAMEKVDNGFCQMTKEQCTNLVVNNVASTVDDEDGTAIDGSTPITRADVWKAQHAEAAIEASKDDAPTWLAPCDTTGICIYCDDFVETVESLWIGEYDATANQTLYASAVEDEFCSASDALATTSCVEAAPRVNWTDALGLDLGPQFIAADADGGDATTAAQTGGKNWASVSAGATMTAAQLATRLDNYTKKSNRADMGTAARELSSWMGYCELAILNYAQDDTKCKDPSINPLGFDDDCGKCISNIGDGFKFTFENSGEDYLACSNFFYGHIHYHCLETAAGSATCQDLFYGTHSSITAAAAADNTKFMIDLAFADGSRSKFCGYSDKACKKKIQDKVENSMTTIGVFGIIFLLFFIAIIYFTMQAIRIYKGDSGDDDGGGEQDFDDE